MLMPASTDVPERLETLTDEALLQRYASAADRAALGELVRRYAGMVYAAACRQTRDTGMADDVVQNVFVIFARRAAHIRSAAAIATWLLRTTHYTAANMTKTEKRRRRHEHAASLERNEITQSGGAADDHHWEALSPLIDRAIARLAPADQTAVVLRFFRGLSLRDLADATGTTEEAARKRVSRAIDKLRQYLIRAGAPADACTSLLLPALLGSRAIGHAPPAVVSHAVAAAVNGKAAGIAIGSALGAKFAITGIIVLVAAAATVVKVTGLLQVSGGSPSPATQPAPDASDWQANFFATYGLKPGENIKYLVPPYIPERDFYFTDVLKGAGFKNNPPTSDKLAFIFDGLPDGTVKWRSATRIVARRAMDMRHLVRGLIPSLQDWQLEIGDSLLPLSLPGDWVVRPDATPEQALPAIETAVQQAYGRTVKFNVEHVDREVFVMSGALKPKLRHVHLGIPPAPNHRLAVMGTLTVNTTDFAADLSDATGFPFLDETGITPTRENAFDFDLRSTSDTGQTEDEFLADFTQSISDQTGLKFERTHRTVDIYTLDETPTTKADANDWQPAFLAAYGLKNGENLKYVPPPFIPEKSSYYDARHAGRAKPDPDWINQPVIFDGQPDGNVEWRMWGVSPDLRSIVQSLTGLRNWQIEENAGLLRRELKGDWVMRKDAATDQVLSGMEPILHEQLFRDLKFTRDTVDKDIIVISGDIDPNKRGVIQVQIPRTPKHHAIRTGGGGLDYFADSLSTATGFPFLNDPGAGRNVMLEFNTQVIPDDGRSEDQFLDDLMASISDQSGLTLKREHRKMDIWTLSE